MISLRHRCLFVHVPKTGGTSIKHRLAGYDPVHRREPDPAEARLVYTHLGAAALRRHLAEMAGAQAADYFQFAFVRNPWDRVVSAFAYLSAGGEGGLHGLAHVAAVHPFKGDFARFVREGLAQALTRVPYFWPQHLWTHDGLDPTQPLHFIGRFERLEADFDQVLDRLGLSRAPALPRLRSVDHGDYTACYDARAQAVVAELYARDIALFGYRFGA